MTGGLEEVRNLKTGAVIREPGTLGPVFSVRLRKPGARELLPAEGVRFDCKSVRAEGDGKLVWRIRVDNATDLEVRGVEFPSLSRVRIGPTADDDHLIWPHGGGHDIVPSVRLPGWLQDIPYNGSASLQWCDLYEPGAGGIYLGAHDKTLLGMRLRAIPDAARTRLTRRPGRS